MVRCGAIRALPCETDAADVSRSRRLETCVDGVHPRVRELLLEGSGLIEGLRRDMMTSTED